MGGFKEPIELLKLEASMKTLLLGLLGGLVVANIATADQGGRPASAVVELFTSQGCYSCPPADILLGELIKRRPDVVSLAFHVDYWDELVYGDAGKWRDPFSSADHTKRQRQYHGAAIGGNAGVYTPQMVINGENALVGTDSKKLRARLAEARRPPVDVYIKRKENTLEVKFKGRTEKPVDVWLVSFIPSARTPVTSGENSGKFLRNYNVVTSIRKIGKWWPGSGSVPLNIDSSRISESDHCGILLQQAGGPILGAAYCPS